MTYVWEIVNFVVVMVAVILVAVLVKFLLF